MMYWLYFQKVGFDIFAGWFFIFLFEHKSLESKADKSKKNIPRKLLC